MQSLGKLRLPALACSAALLICELISRPWAEMGISDDWSYIRSAQILAQTGHIVYVGWASAIVGWQLYLGAALIKIFGFSFTAPRIGTILIAYLTAFLLQRTLVRLGINDRNAALGTLIFVLSPLFMMLSATMMSDVPGFFAVLICIYGCVRALQASRNRTTILWLWFAVAANAICGTSRQIAWLGVLVIVPSTLWLLRTRRRVLIQGLIATAVGYILVFAALHWFNVQPYALPEPVTFPPLRIWTLKVVALQYVRSAMEIVLLLFPVSLPFIAGVRRFSRRNLAGLAALAIIAPALIFYLGHVYGFVALFNPLNGDWVGPHAIYESTFLVSNPPAILSHGTLTILSLVALLGTVCIGGTLLLSRPAAIEPQPVGTLSWHQLAILFGPLSFFYLLLLSRHAEVVIFDRYLFTPLFVALACLLRYSQERLKDRLPALTVATAAAIAFYGVLCTHNLFALDRARVLLANEVLATGLPPSHIDLGWEQNGWYELQQSAYINEPHIVRPAGAYRFIPEPNRQGCHEQTTFGFFPHLAPRYGVSFDPNACGGPAPFAPVSYTTWPRRQPTTLYVVQYPPPWKSAIDYAASSDASSPAVLTNK